MLTPEHIKEVLKDPNYYGKLWPHMDKNAPYWWPVDLLDKIKNKKMKEYWKSAVC